MMIARVTMTLLFAFVNFTYGQTIFQDVTVQSGIDHAFEPYQGTFGGGAAIIDFDNDGLEDIYLTGGLAADALYKNLGNGSFTNVITTTGISQVTDTTITQGVTCADVNKDGWIDIFVTTIASFSDREIPRAHDLLFINQGDGTFVYSTAAYGLDKLKTFSTGASFGDINHDGYPDLFVANYFKEFSENLKDFSGSVLGTSELSNDQLYININGNYFQEQSKSYGLDHKGFGFGGFFSDYDNDRDLDLFVINDFGNRATPNLLYRNEYPKSRFEDVSDKMQFNLGMNGMGAAIGDCNNDGWMDYFITNMRASPLYLGQGPNTPFLQNSVELGTAFSSLDVPNVGKIITISWGAIFFDYDHDGDLDLFFSNGALNPSVLPNPNILLENFDGYYRDISELAGLGDIAISRGAVTFDYDNDGDLDLLVVNQKPIEHMDRIGDSYTKLYQNNASAGNWLKIKLKGKISDSDGIGARVEIVTGHGTMIREVDGGSSHESQNSTIVHFGVGHASLIDTVKIRWIGGAEQILTQIPANQTLTIEEKVNTIEDANVNLYPTLFSNTVNLSLLFPIEATFTLKIVNVQGKVLERIKSEVPQRYASINWSVPLSTQNGLYFFIVNWGDGQYVIKRGIKFSF